MLPRLRGPTPSGSQPQAPPRARRLGWPSSQPAPLHRGLNPEALYSAVWVDDIIFVTKTLEFPACLGLDGACQVCIRAARAASCSQSYWRRLTNALGLGLSDDKRQLPSQRVTYTGIVVDTFQRTLSVPPPADKHRKLATFLEGFFSCRSSTAQQLASLRGRVQHYSICMPYVLPSGLVTLFCSVLGSESEPDYDRVVDVPAAVTDAAFFIHGVLEEYTSSGSRLWPFVASSLFAAVMAGETGDARIAVITWDASLHGWGPVLRWWSNRSGKVVVGTLPHSADLSAAVVILAQRRIWRPHRTPQGRFRLRVSLSPAVRSTGPGLPPRAAPGAQDSSETRGTPVEEGVDLSRPPALSATPGSGPSPPTR